MQAKPQDARANSVPVIEPGAPGSTGAELVKAWHPHTVATLDGVGNQYLVRALGLNAADEVVHDVLDTYSLAAPIATGLTYAGAIAVAANASSDALAAETDIPVSERLAVVRAQ